MSFDTKKDVEDKFMAILSKFFNTLAFVSDQLVKDGFNAPNAKLIMLAKSYVEGKSTPEGLILAFAKASYRSWDKIFERDPDFIRDNLPNLFGENAPDYCKQVADGILNARKPDGEPAVPEKSREFLNKLLEGFVILSIKELFWMSSPVGVVQSGDGYEYIFSESLSDFEDLDLNREIRLRKVPGLPTKI